MKHIPADIDELMWAVAEDGGARAIEDFESRFPDLRYELGRRSAMVRQLRGARGEASEGSGIPRFQVRPAKPSPWRARTLGAIAVAVLGALAYGSYRMTAGWLQRPTTAPIVREGPSVQPQSNPNAMVDRPEPRRTVEQDPTQSAPLPDKYARRISIRVDREPLVDVLQRIAIQANLRLQIGPGLENPTIQMEYVDSNALAILEDMGRQLGFTPFYEGGGNVLIVPAVDPKKVAEGTPSSGSAHIVDDVAPAKTGEAPSGPVTR